MIAGAAKRFGAGFFILSLSLALAAAAYFMGGFERRSVPVDFNQRYLPIARGILERSDFLLDGRAPSPPLYPLALAGMLRFLPDARRAAAAINIMAMALLALTFHALVRRQAGGRIALIAAIVWTTYPFGVYLAAQPGPEPLYLLALLLAAWSVLEAREARPLAALAAGVASSQAALVKPIALFLSGAFLLFLIVLWARRRMGLGRLMLGGLVFTGGALATLLPWELHLWQRTGRLIPVAELAGSSIYDGWTFGIRPGAGGDRASLPEDVGSLMNEIEMAAPGMTDSEVLSAVRKAAAERPGAFIKLFLIKAGRCWYGTDEMWHEGKTLAIQALYLILSLMGAVAWHRRGRPGTTLVSVLAVLVLYHWAAATAALSILRYMVPAGFLIALMAAFITVKLLRA